MPLSLPHLSPLLAQRIPNQTHSYVQAPADSKTVERVCVEALDLVEAQKPAGGGCETRFTWWVGGEKGRGERRNAGGLRLNPTFD